MAKEKPILFSTEMVRAILDGRKTQTRRIVRPQGIKCYKGVYAKPCNGGYLLNTAANSLYCSECGNIIEYSPEGKDYCKTIDAPYCIGEILWVRETWLKDCDGKYFYKATMPEDAEDQRVAFGYSWKPSIHMPRVAARLFLRVTNVRVERLWDVTEDDAMAEGFTDRFMFHAVWASIYKNVAENPWVWVIEFEVVRANG